MASSSRGTEAPMDFQWTNRLEVKPSWATDNSTTPRKRLCCSFAPTFLVLIRFSGPHDDINPVTPAIGIPQTPIFGSNKNVPFMFNTAPSNTQHPPPWAPPPFFSPEKAFPKTFREDITDVDMSDISPQRFEERKVEHGRAVAPGAMRRVYNSRQKSRDTRVVRKQAEEEHGDSDHSDTDDDATRPLRPLTQNTSNHYTLNLPAAISHRSDLPYVLLGYVFYFSRV